MASAMRVLRKPADVGVVLDDDAAYVAHLPDGPIHVLDVVGAIIWEEALAGDEAELAARVAGRTGAEVEEVRVHVEGFVANLLALGLLSASGGPAARA